MLLRYFDWRISMADPLSAWMLVIAAVLGVPLFSVPKVTVRRASNDAGSVQ